MVFVIPGSIQSWPNRAACWSPAIPAIGILVAVLYQVLVRAGREDQAMMTTLAGLVIVLSMVIQQISSLFNTVRTLFDL